MINGFQNRSYQKALKVVDDTSRNAVLLQKVGRSFIFKCDWDASLVNLNKCLNVYRQFLSNSSTASTLYALGVCLHMMNDHQQALLTFTECRREMKKVITEDRLKLGHLHLWAGQQFFRLEEHLKASKRFTSALRIYKENRCNVEEGIIVETLHLLGQVHVENKQLHLALKCFDEEVLLFESTTALHSNVKISEAYYCAGIVNVETGNDERAKKCFEKSSEVLNVGSGEESERLAKSLEQLGALHTKEHNLTEAISLLTQAHRMYENVLGSSHTSIAISAFKLGHALNADGQFQQAKKYYVQCLQIRVNLLTSDHEDIATTHFFLGRNAFSLSEMKEAIDSLQKVS
jgi:TolA-binding protein